MRIYLVHRNAAGRYLAVLKTPHTLHLKAGILQLIDQPVECAIIYLDQGVSSVKRVFLR